MADYLEWEKLEELNSRKIADVIDFILMDYKTRLWKTEQNQNVRNKKKQDEWEKKKSELEKNEKGYYASLKVESDNLKLTAKKKYDQEISKANSLKEKNIEERNSNYKKIDDEIFMARSQGDFDIKKLNDLTHKINDIKASLEFGKNSKLFFEIEKSTEIVKFSFIPETPAVDIDFRIVNNFVRLFNSETGVLKKKEAYNHGTQLWSFIRWAYAKIKDDIEFSKRVTEEKCTHLEGRKREFDNKYIEDARQPDRIKTEAEKTYSEEISCIDAECSEKILNMQKSIKNERDELLRREESEKQNEKSLCIQEKDNIVNEFIRVFSESVPKEELLRFISVHKHNALKIENFECRNDVPLGFEVGELRIEAIGYYFDTKITSFLRNEYGFVFDDRYLRLPYTIDFFEGKNLCITYNAADDDKVMRNVQYLAMDILLTSPAASVNFGFIDPLKSTNTFAPFNKFVDYNKESSKLLNGGIATSQSAITEKLSIIAEHIENVISSCLQSSDMSILEYNKMAGENAEPYLYLMVMDFPAGFNLENVKQLEKIIETGPRCGVYTVLMNSNEQLAITDVNTNQMFSNMKGKMDSLSRNGEAYLIEGYGKGKVYFNSMISDSDIDSVAPVFKKAVEDAGRIIIDFENIQVKTEEWAGGNSSEGIEIPIGLVGVDNVQNFSLGGDGVNHHVLIAGSAGSGKTTLLHTIITNALLKYAYDELEIYLVDFKHGVEFKTYADYNLPNIKLVAIESNRKFGYDVLEYLDREQKRRSDIFKQHSGCKNISQYRKITGEKMPRIILIIDEYHELFNSKTSDYISEHSAELLQRVLAQGRAFGIHIILATQSLSNVSGLNQAIYDLISVRIALKCTPNEARLILGEGAEEIKLLKDSGMAIYNYNFGEKQASTVFRVGMLTSDYQEKILGELGNMYLSKGVKAETKVVEALDKSDDKDKVNVHYLDRFSINLPERSKNERKKVLIPFAVDDDNNVIYCDFEDNNFAAYIMGASGSGKTSLLNAMIFGLISNYHPDELELWLLDFKMTEFSFYAQNCPPHVKYILLEKSEELVHNILDKLTGELERRQRIFMDHHWSKITDIPTDMHMPVIFVIIDEFAQMSEIIMESRGAGLGLDYTKKLENLLVEGRSFGFKFVFASQTYNTTSIRGLSETSLKNIQMRFALKNTADEIRATLNLTSGQTDSEVDEWIKNLQIYKTLFKVVDAEGKSKIVRLNNLYIEKEEIREYIEKLNSKFKRISNKSGENYDYVDKKMISVDGTRPKTYKSQQNKYRQYMERYADEIDDDEVLVYPGVARSLSEIRPIRMYNEIGENILVAGGDRDDEANVIKSIIDSVEMQGCTVHVWAYKRNQIFKKFKSVIFNDMKIMTELSEICEDVENLKKKISNKTVSNDLIICLGYGILYNEFDIANDKSFTVRDENTQEKKQEENSEEKFDNAKFMKMFKEAKDDEERKKLRQMQIDSMLKSREKFVTKTVTRTPVISDCRRDIAQLLKIAPTLGTHFLFSFDNPADFNLTRMSGNDFVHKIILQMSKDNMLNIVGRSENVRWENGIFLYTNRNGERFTMREHMHSGIRCMGWMLDDNGEMTKTDDDMEVL